MDAPPSTSAQPQAPRGALHVGPGGITAPGPHIGPDGIALAATSGGPVLDSSLAFKHAGREFNVATAPGMTMSDLKAAIEAATLVPAARQKILGLKRAADGKPPADTDALSDLAPPRPGTRVLVLGAPGTTDPGAALAAAAAVAAAAPPLEDDWASDDSAPGRRAAEEEVPVPDRPENQEKLARRIAAFNPVVRAPPRPGKRLLVCDIGK